MKKRGSEQNRFRLTLGPKKLDPFQNKNNFDFQWYQGFSTFFKNASGLTFSLIEGLITEY